MRPTDHRNDAGTTGEGGPAIPASVAALDGLRRTDADRRSFTSVHKTKRPPADAGGRLAWSRPVSLVAGTGFEPATSGMSNRSESQVASRVSNAQVTINRSPQPSRRVSPYRGSCATFRSQIRSQDSGLQVQPPRREISSALLVAHAAGYCAVPAVFRSPLEHRDMSAMIRQVDRTGVARRPMIPRALAAGHPKAPLPRRGTDAITPGPIYFDVDRMSRLLHGGLFANT